MSALPHQRQRTSSTASVRISVSSTEAAPDRSTWTNSTVRRDTVRSNRVRFPHSAHRQRVEASGAAAGIDRGYSRAGEGSSATWDQNDVRSTAIAGAERSEAPPSEARTRPPQRHRPETRAKAIHGNVGGRAYRPERDRDHAAADRGADLVRRAR